MNNPNEAGMSETEMMALAGLLLGPSHNRQARRRATGGLHASDNKPKFDREKRRRKNRDARKARARNRGR